MPTMGKQRSSYRQMVMVHLYKRDCGICPMCERTIYNDDSVEIDHILPVSKEGPDDMDNLRLIHHGCHKKRHGKRTDGNGFGINRESVKNPTVSTLKAARRDAEKLVIAQMQKCMLNGFSFVAASNNVGLSRYQGYRLLKLHKMNPTDYRTWL
jgi:hypothetical protein